MTVAVSPAKPPCPPVERELERLFRLWTVRGTWIGAALFLLIAPLDFVTIPDQAARFLVVRVATAAALLLIGALARRAAGGSGLRVLVFAGVLVSAAAIEFMIMGFAGHASPYAMGMALVGVTAISLIPAGAAFHTLLAATVLGTYVLPLLLLGDELPPPPFLTQCSLLAALLGVMVLIRHLHRRALVRELTSAHELARHELTLAHEVEQRTEQLLRASNEWRATFDSAGDLLLLADEEGRIVKANRAAADFAGRSFPELLGSPVLELFPEGDLPRSRHPLEAMRASGERAEAEFRHSASGRWFSLSAEPILPGSDLAGGAVLSARDVTEHKRMVEEVDAAAARLELILERSPVGTFIVGEGGRVEYGNPAIIRITGCEHDRFVGAALGEFPGCAELGMGERIAAAFAGRPFRHGPAVFHCADGKREIVGRFTGVPIEVDGRRKVLMFVEDVTELQRAEEERQRFAALLQQAQKMESIGTLASGIAHDFNNILLAVIGLTDAAAERLPPGHPARGELDAVLGAAERGSDLVRQLLAFSREQDLRTQPVDLRALVEQTNRMLRPMLPRNIAIEIGAAGEGLTVVADPGQIQQVLLNLAVNARDAMPEGGTLAISTFAAEVAGDDAGHPGVPPGRYGVLRVSDTGLGIPAEHQARIFDPFFSTKEPGKGTGLGLATAYGIVTQHGGAVQVRSAPGEGAAFSVYLPVTSGVAAPPGSRPRVPRGTETLLLVEDDEKSRLVIGRRLEELGYRVLAAADGEEALRRLEEEGGAADLLLCDVVLPGPSARATAAALTARLPRLRVLYVSGHPEEALLGRGLLEPGDAVVPKGLGTDEVARRVREALDAAAPGTAPDGAETGGP